MVYKPITYQNVKNLCSAFSYCISILQTFYVWYGRGSILQERQAALEYARKLAANEASVIELTEGENDSDEMFWMILGNDEYAKADYWQWRRCAAEVDPRVWRIAVDQGDAAVGRLLFLFPIQSTDALQRPPKVHPVTSLAREITFQTSVYIVDCVWELFVLVGKDARGKRLDIQLAVSVATVRPLLYPKITYAQSFFRNFQLMLLHYDRTDPRFTFWCYPLNYRWTFDYISVVSTRHNL